jgi:hypothetical protein
MKRRTFLKLTTATVGVFAVPMMRADGIARKAVRFTLSEDVTAAIPPGEEKLFRMALGFTERFRPLDAGERADLLAKAQGIRPLFRA